MLKRLFLVVLLWTTWLLPVVSVAENTVPSPENSEKMILNDESRCDAGTFGVYGGGEPIKLRAIWNPKLYSCPAGEYLRKPDTESDPVECEICPEDSYCPGFTDHVYDDSDFGKEPCPTGYIVKSEGSSRIGQCYKIEDVPCSRLMPYDSIGHAIGITYTEENISCKKYYDEDYVCESVCEIAELQCEEGYMPKFENGIWSCVEKYVDCRAGTYLPRGMTECVVCPEDNFCEGGHYELPEPEGLKKCPEGLRAPQGSTSIADCGKILRVDGDALYLYPDKTGERKTGPRFVVKDADGTWYADMTPVSEGKKKVSEGATKELHVKVGDVEYTVHTTISEPKKDSGETEGSGN